MANVNITGLPVSISADGSEWIPVQRLGQTAQRVASSLLFNLPDNAQSANTVFSGPTSGSAAAPAFRALLAADLTGGTGGTSGYVLQTNGTVASWVVPTSLGIDLDVGSTAITNGTNGRLLYQAGGAVLGEISSGTAGYLLGTDGTTPVFQGFLQSGTGAATRTWQAKGRDFVSIKDFGAVGDGVTDDTVAIDAARAASNSLYAPNGNYVYNGNGLEPNGLYLYGNGSAVLDSGGTMGVGNTTFTIGSGKTLIAGTSTVGSCLIRDIAALGGYGFFFHNAPAGIIVQNDIIISNVSCYNYTGCAIEHNSDDWPYWHIMDCTFYAANDSTTMGIALKGDCSGSHVVRCNFLNNRVDIKHDKASSGGISENMTIFGCDFVHFTSYAGHARYRVWIVPSTSTNTKPGYIAWSDFGNENLSTHGQDYHILFADAGSGATNGQKFPSLVASTGAISDLYIDKCSFGGAGASAPAPITSYTNRLIGLTFSDPVIVGTAPALITEIVAASATTPDDTTFGNLIRIGGTSVGINTQNSGVTTSACNAVGLFQVQDPNAVLNDAANALPYLGGSDACGFVNLIPGALVPSISLAGTAAVVGTTDSLGGSNAGTITLAATFDSAYFTFGTAVTPGVPLWLECDMQSGGASPLSYAGMHLMNNGVAAGTHRYIALTSNWRRIRIPYTPKATGANQIVFSNLAGATGTFKLGRVRVYHANEPTAVTSGIAVGTSAIYGGTTTRILYDNAGVLGEYTITGSGTVVAMQTSPTFLTNITTPLVIGGTAAGSSAEIRATSGTGTTEFTKFTGGTNGATEWGRFVHGGNFAIGSTTGSATFTAGDDLGTSFGAAASLVVGAATGGRAGNAFIILGQDSSHNLNFGWTYNATAANATAAIATFGYANALAIDGATLNLNVASSGLVSVGSGGLRINGATIGSNALAVAGGVAGAVQIWSGAVSTALSTLTGGSDGFRTSAANVTQLAGENTSASSSSAGGFVGMYSNDGAAMASGDRLGGMRAGGSSSASALRNSALIGAFADQAWVDASAYGSRWEFQTTTNGATSASTKLILGNGGVLSFGATVANTVPALKPSSTTLAVRLGDDSADAPLSASTLYATGDAGGVASTNALSNANSTTISSGTGTVKMSTTNSANNAVWIKLYAGTTAYWVPGWTTNAP